MKSRSDSASGTATTNGTGLELTHLDSKGRVRMVDVSDKASTLREAVAEAVIGMKAETFAMIQEGRARKGNVLETARIAGIQGAKRTSELIPMCHPLLLTHVAVDFLPQPATHAFRITATVRTHGPTGVEMEALTAAATAALTIYDMCKAVDRDMLIGELCLKRKSGGKSGTYIRASSRQTP